MSRLPVPSGSRRQTVSLVERDMNRFDDNNLTLPITKSERTKHKRGVSMGGALDGLSEVQILRRKAQPRKSILKAQIEPEPTSSPSDDLESRTGQIVDYENTIDFGALAKSQSKAPRASMPAQQFSGRMSLGPRRRVSFAPAAHVRMFEQADKKPRRKSSMLPRQFGPSTSQTADQSPSRPRSSLPSMPNKPRASFQSPVRQTPQAPVSPRARFLGEGEELGEESMDIESEQSFSTADDSDEILTQVAALSPARPNTPAPPIDDGSSDVDAEGEMDMDETMVGGGIVGQQWAEADTDDASSDSDSDMSLEDGAVGDASASDEEKTMDFTVALGGPMPSVPPQGATRNRASLGYSVAGAAGDAPLLPGEGGSDDEMDMEETAAYGTIYVNDESTSSTSDTSNRGEHTQTFAMDFTTAIGGIVQQDQSGVDMSMTTVGGGIEDQSGMDFTTAIGGIERNTTVYRRSMTTTTTTTNIFAPAVTPGHTASRPADAPPTAPPTRLNIFAPTPASAAPKPRVSVTQPALTPFAPGPAQEARLEEVENTPPSPPRRVRGSSATPARPTPSGTPRRMPRESMSGTPSFARPTSASASKARDRAAPASASKPKRNAYGPSPEPDEVAPELTRSKSRTPRKSTVGLETAGSVAKKLDFSAPATPNKTLGSAASTSTTPRATPHPPTTTTPRATPAAPPSSALKRAREDDPDEPEDEVHPNKRRRSNASVQMPEMAASHVEEEQEQDPLDAAQAERQVTPEADPENRPLPTYTPIARGTPRKSLGPPRRSMATEPEPIEEELEAPPAEPEVEPVDIMANLPSHENVEIQNIDLQVFLQMVGISWQDDLPRRQSVGRGMLSRRKSQVPKGHEFPLSDYIEANLESIFVSMFDWATEETQSKIRQSEEILASIEHVCSQQNPPVIHDYLAADEEDRGVFESVLLQIKSVTYLRARARWYDWKLNLLSDKVVSDVRGIRDDMLHDAERHRSERETVDKVLPELRKRREELEAELAAHRAEVEAIMACDQDELAALKEGIEEQDTELERFRSELDGKTSKNDEVEAQIAELDSQCNVHLAALEAARSTCDQLTTSDVVRLEAELAALQDLHGWRVLHAGSRLELEYSRELRLSVPCHPEPELERATLELASKPCPASPNTGLLTITQAALAGLRPTSLRSLLNAVAQLWSAARGVRDELRRLALYYPVAYSTDKDTFTATAVLMLPRARAKARLSMTLGPDALFDWPEAARALPILVDAAYGKVDTVGLTQRAKETLGSADLNLAGVLFQACAEAAALYA